MDLAEWTSQPISASDGKRSTSGASFLAMCLCLLRSVALSAFWVGRLAMWTFETLPGESNASIISSITNLVCPQCGGRMLEFQCVGQLPRFHFIPQTEISFSLARPAVRSCPVRLTLATPTLWHVPQV